jgi:hypothetical protein
MDANTINGYTRQDLWDRLEQADYFDWCRKEEFKQLRALFFDGVVVEFPKMPITCRELVWSPLRGEAHWQSVIEARSREWDTHSEEVRTSEAWGKAFADDSLHGLLFEDMQPYGMTVDDQVALIQFLGFERRSPFNTYWYIDAWICEIEVWLAGKARGEYGMAGLADTVACRTADLFYQMLTEAPLAMKGKRLVVSEERTGWNDDRAAMLHSTLKDLFKTLDSYRLPRKLACDPAPRLQIVESLRNDLESDAAPQILRDAWNLWRSARADNKAKAQARAQAQPKAG